MVWLVWLWVEEAGVGVVYGDQPGDQSPPHWDHIHCLWSCPCPDADPVSAGTEANGAPVVTHNNTSTDAKYFLNILLFQCGDRI